MSLNAITLEDIISKTQELPSMPSAAIAVLHEVENQEATATSIGRHLARDQALAVRVLRLANSAFYGLPREVGDITESVMVLGTRVVRNLVLVASTYSWMSRPLPGYDMGPEKLWEHSFAVAIGAQLLAKTTGRDNLDHAFTAGLLHNLGKVVLSVWLENKLFAMQLLAEKEELSFDEAERKVFGYDHAEVGAHLGERWNLPKKLVNVMRYHHTPDLCDPHDDVVDCVHLADCLASSLGMGLGGDGMRYRVSAAALERLNLADANMDKLAGDLLEEHDRYMQMLQGN